MDRSTQSPPRLLVDKHTAAKIIGGSPRRLGDAQWRRRYCLPATRIGGSLRFDVAILHEWLRRRRERFGAGSVA